MSTTFIYVLKCQNDKYYVGRTIRPLSRYREHLQGKGSEWTRLYPVIKKVHEIEGDNFDEDKITKMYMMKYGIENVRGGSYSNIILSQDQINCLTKEIRNASDACFHCGSTSHYARHCKYLPLNPQKHTKYLFKPFLNFSCWIYMREMLNLIWKFREIFNRNNENVSCVSKLFIHMTRILNFA